MEESFFELQDWRHFVGGSSKKLPSVKPAKQEHEIRAAALKKRKRQIASASRKRNRQG